MIFAQNCIVLVILALFNREYSFILVCEVNWCTGAFIMTDRNSSGALSLNDLDLESLFNGGSEVSESEKSYSNSGDSDSDAGSLDQQLDSDLDKGCMSKLKVSTTKSQRNKKTKTVLPPIDDDYDIYDDDNDEDAFIRVVRGFGDCTSPSRKKKGKGKGKTSAKAAKTSKKRKLPDEPSSAKMKRPVNVNDASSQFASPAAESVSVKPSNSTQFTLLSPPAKAIASSPLRRSPRINSLVLTRENQNQSAIASTSSYAGSQVHHLQPDVAHSGEGGSGGTVSIEQWKRRLFPDEPSEASNKGKKVNDQFT